MPLKIDYPMLPADDFGLIADCNNQIGLSEIVGSSTVDYRVGIATH